MRGIIFCLLTCLMVFANLKGFTIKKNAPALNQIKPLFYQVIAIKDGDTIEILMDNAPLTIRLAHIDCPEKKQPFGTKAKQFVSEQCFGKNVTLIHQNKYDRNHRLIAEVILPNGKNLNKLLVQNGLAWHFLKYSSNEEYDDLEKLARAKKMGIWSDPNPIAPWDWRKMRSKKS